MLELYTTLTTCEVEEDELIFEENIDGMDIMAGVMFADAEGRSGTEVTLRLGYYLPGELSCCMTLLHLSCKLWLTQSPCHCNQAATGYAAIMDGSHGQSTPHSHGQSTSHSHGQSTPYSQGY